MIEQLEELRRRVEVLERDSHPPIDVAKLIVERAETIARLVEADPHQFSTRPCPTCRPVSQLLGRAFGCDAKRARAEGAARDASSLPSGAR